MEASGGLAVQLARHLPVERCRSGALPTACAKCDRRLAGELGQRTAAMACCSTGGITCNACQYALRCTLTIFGGMRLEIVAYLFFYSL